MNRGRNIIVSTLIALLAGHLMVDAARAHEEGVLTLASPRATAGSALGLKGTDFSGRTTYLLVLKGALRSFELGRVTSDTAGSFEVQLELPAEAGAGSYRLVAVAPDGDEVSAVELELEAAPINTAPVEPQEVAAGHAGPNAELLNIERDWSGAEWFVLGALFGGALAGGVVLLRRTKSEA